MQQVIEETLVVPLMSTLSEAGGTHFIYVVSDDSTLVRRDVTLGEFSDMYIQVSGVYEDDMIVLNPTPQMYDGMQIRPLQVAS